VNPSVAMQVVVPMSGFGERFRKAGYVVPKPLIEIEGKPIIAHVIDMFPGETDFIFICSQDHLSEPAYRMREILDEYCPTGRVIGIPSHKLGPVYAIGQVTDLIDPNRPVVVNYCDFTCYWDWLHFKSYVVECGCDGAIPAYRGFHPHSLGKTNYAYILETRGWVKDIQEKQPFTRTRMAEFASSGTYYFASGTLMREAFSTMQARRLTVDGEFYVSLAYKPLIESGKRIVVYDLQHFMQWGTPEDVTEYRMWSQAFRHLIYPRQNNQAVLGGVTLIPLAGLGERFAREGFTKAKPLIPVSGQPMVVQAACDLPESERHVFVMRSDMTGYDEIEAALNLAFPSVQIVDLKQQTDGQARTALMGWQAILTEQQVSGPLTIGACDSGAVYSSERLRQLVDDPNTDVIVWVIRGYPNAARHPHMYGWISCAEGTDRVVGVSVKTPLEDPTQDPIITGTFTFRRGADFARAVERMVAREARVNGEFYIDTCIEDALNLGLTVRIFEIDSYLCWGTPNDLRTYEYWQSCFDKWSQHPYSIENDRAVLPLAVASLRWRYRATVPLLPDSIS
jgi:NDP-sugar pyrophosphorylase family protein